MSMFDQVLGALEGTASPGAASTQSVLLDLLANHEGGLGGFLQRFQSAGLAQTAESWIGSGANLPISPQMIQEVMGSQMMQQLAARTGLPLDQLANQVAEHLPAVVDGLTPNGQTNLSGSDLLSAGAALLRSRFGIG
jgi:uncharacterized protein YidB (DUF937 family)